LSVDDVLGLDSSVGVCNLKGSIDSLSTVCCRGEDAISGFNNVRTAMLMKLNIRTTQINLVQLCEFTLPLILVRKYVPFTAASEFNTIS
jgi:hypothetical protein